MWLYPPNPALIPSQAPKVANRLSDVGFGQPLILNFKGPNKYTDHRPYTCTSMLSSPSVSTACEIMEHNRPSRIMPPLPPVLHLRSTLPLTSLSLPHRLICHHAILKNVLDPTTSRALARFMTWQPI